MLPITDLLVLIINILVLIIIGVLFWLVITTSKRIIKLKKAFNNTNHKY